MLSSGDPLAAYRKVVATENLPAGVSVGIYAGPIVPWAAVPPEEIRYAAHVESDRWLIPETDARFINHSCDASCVVFDSLAVVTVRPVSRGEELTVSYDQVDADEYLADPNAHFWDERWSFDCRCGSALCVGRVDGYRITGKARDWQALRNEDRRTPLEISEIPGKGRGVRARTSIRAGTRLDQAPILFLPGEQWPNLKQTAIYDYCFWLGIGRGACRRRPRHRLTLQSLLPAQLPLHPKSGVANDRFRLLARYRGRRGDHRQLQRRSRRLEPPLVRAGARMSHA